jgi:adenine phosphoribosyltransferase
MITYLTTITSEIVRRHIPVYQDWPKDGIQYMNTVELCQTPIAFNMSVQWFKAIADTYKVQDIFAADARGFIWGSTTAIQSGLPLHVVRKPGKLPGNVWSQSYELEYGTDTLELLASTPTGDRPVLIVDDVLATGGTAEAICKLLHNNLNIPYSSMIVAVLVNLTFLPGQARLEEKGVKVFGLLNE